MESSRRKWLALASAGVAGWARAQTRRRVLYYTASGGFEHSVVARTGGQLSHSERVLTDMGRFGFEVECTKDGRLFDGSLKKYDAIAFYTSGDLTKPGPGNPQPMSLAGKNRLLDAIAGGKAFVGFHAATDAFRSPTGIDPYTAMIGAEFLIHGEQQEASLTLCSKFPGLAGLGIGEGIAFHEEWYAQKNFAGDLHVILIQETLKMKGAPYRRPNFPCTWARRHGRGRVFYTSLGHREDIWVNPSFQTIALGGFAWAMGDVEFDAKPNIGEVTPQANQLKEP